MRPTLIAILALALSFTADAEEGRSAAEKPAEVVEPAADAEIPMDCKTACDFEAFKTQLNAWAKSQGAEGLEEEKLREIFAAGDKNGDNTLDQKEAAFAIEIRELAIRAVVDRN
jgi:hypothetical protein